jgi:DNA-binding NtrC family response regulator
MLQPHGNTGIQELPRGRILLVDDDPGLLRLLSIRLRAERYDVEAVESAGEALAALARISWSRICEWRAWTALRS